AAAALAAVAVLAVALPALRAARAAAGEAAEDDNLRRLDEFEEDVAGGDVDAAAAPALRAELERAVVDAVSAAPPLPARAGRRSALLFTALTPVLALVVYLELGEPGVAQFTLENPGADLADPRQAVELLLASVRDRTESHPEDREAWTVLARTNMQLGRYDEALAAAERLAALAPADAGVKLLLVDAIAMSSQGALVPRAVSLIEEVLAGDPDNVNALVLKGIAEEQQGRREAAIALWRQARARAPAGSPLAAEIDTMLTGLGADTKSAATVSVTASISLAPELAADLGPDTPVFVLARAASGPAVPLAVARHTVAELPLAVALDDTMGMLPGTSLADFDSVYVVARVARSGGPLPQSGDFEGRSAPFTPTADTKIDILIDVELP
ncbi:MAG: c-type cytochrome biogenesis protein CcmI, partial [Gammaproteobacteria bacterium]